MAQPPLPPSLRHFVITTLSLLHPQGTGTISTSQSTMSFCYTALTKTIKRSEMPVRAIFIVCFNYRLLPKAYVFTFVTMWCNIKINTVVATTNTIVINLFQHYQHNHPLQILQQTEMTKKKTIGNNNSNYNELSTK